MRMEEYKQQLQKIAEQKGCTDYVIVEKEPPCEPIKTWLLNPAGRCIAVIMGYFDCGGKRMVRALYVLKRGK
jgi:hypothetical protein